jgi:CheY-like chemotaxis protein
LVAYSAEQAIERIASSIPDLALLDVNLPGMNGIDLAIVLKANHPDCHLLLLSGHESTRGLLEEAAKKGYIFDILAKPIHPTFILERVKGLISGPKVAIALTD